MNSKIKTLAVIILILVVSACDQNTPSPVVSVATDATLAPMSFMNNQNQMAGFEIDLIRAISKKVDFEMQLTNVEWAGLMGGMATGKYDMAISSITILEERKKKMDFSRPYLKSGLAIVVPKDNPDIFSIKDLETRKLKVGAQRGTTAYFFLEKRPEIQAIAYEHYGHAIQDMLKGEVDAVIGESTGTLYYKNNDNAIFQKIKMVGEVLTDEAYGIVVSKNNKNLLAKVDRALEEFLEDGTILRLHKKWELGHAASVPSN